MLVVSGSGPRAVDCRPPGQPSRARLRFRLATRRSQLATVRVREVRVRAVAVRVTENPDGWRVDVSAPAVAGGERLRLRSSSLNQSSLVLSLRRPRLMPRLNAADGCRRPISVGHQYAKSSLSMIVRRLGGARTSSTTTDAAKPPRRSRRYPSTDAGTIAEWMGVRGRVSMIRSKRADLLGDLGPSDPALNTLGDNEFRDLSASEGAVTVRAQEVEFWVTASVRDAASGDDER